MTSPASTGSGSNPRDAAAPPTTPPPAAPMLLPTLRAAPPLEPPFDDERVERQLWLVPQFEQLPFDEPPAPSFEPPVQFDPRPASRHSLPDAEPWARRFVHALLEALVGRRATSQLQDWTTPVVLATVVRAVRSQRWSAGRDVRPAVRSVHVSEPADGVLEACAVIQRGPRFFAIALRLEKLDGRWRCTALQLG